MFRWEVSRSGSLEAEPGQGFLKARASLRETETRQGEGKQGGRGKEERADVGEVKLRHTLTGAPECSGAGLLSGVSHSWAVDMEGSQFSRVSNCPRASQGRRLQVCGSLYLHLRRGDGGIKILCRGGIGQGSLD